MVVHNETSTGAVSRIPEIREAIDRAGHPALFIADTISSLASIDYRHDEWGVDVTVGCSQKGLMLPPGLGLNALSGESARGLEIGEAAAVLLGLGADVRDNRTGFFPYTPATNLLFGLREALRMLFEEGLDNVFARHLRHARSHAPGGPRVGAGNPLHGPAGIQPRADGGPDDAGGPRRRRVPQGRPREFQHVPRGGPRRN